MAYIVGHKWISERGEKVWNKHNFFCFLRAPLRIIFTGLILIHSFKIPSIVNNVPRLYVETKLSKF
jgi:hypothetical protein